MAMEIPGSGIVRTMRETARHWPVTMVWVVVWLVVLSVKVFVT